MRNPLSRVHVWVPIEQSSQWGFGPKSFNKYQLGVKDLDDELTKYFWLCLFKY